MKRLITTEQAISLLPKRRKWLRAHIDDLCIFGPHEIKSEAIIDKMKKEFNVFVDPTYRKDGFGLSVEQDGHVLYIEHDPIKLNQFDPL